MIKWFLDLPKKIFVVLVLGIAIIFIVLQDPPHTICRTQLENFKSRQKGIIYKNPAVKTRKKPIMFLLINECKKNSTPGSCYGLFSKIKKFIHDFKLISYDCRTNLSNISEVKKVLFKTYSLMVRLAWGDTAPAVEYYNKFNWFSDVDISLFCLIKTQISTLYGNKILFKLDQKVFKKLPGIEGKRQKQIRELSIVSTNCSS